jgi:hypothetical protein
MAETIGRSLGSPRHIGTDKMKAAHTQPKSECEEITDDVRSLP